MTGKGNVQWYIPRPAFIITYFVRVQGSYYTLVKFTAKPTNNNVIKISVSFPNQLPSNPQDYAIVKMIYEQQLVTLIYLSKV